MAKVYIGRLSYDVVVQDIEDAFKYYGTINKIELKHGFAFVEYLNEKDAEDAISGLNGREIKGSSIIVQHSKGLKESRSRIPKVLSICILLTRSDGFSSIGRRIDFRHELARPKRFRSRSWKTIVYGSFSLLFNSFL